MKKRMIMDLIRIMSMIIMMEMKHEGDEYNENDEIMKKCD